jgi:uncharacterized phage protein gp47/JayE
MPFRRSTLSDLRLRARSIFAAKLKGADATLPRSNITVSSDVMAALVYGIFGYADWLSRQALPNTADDWYYLLRWGSLFGLAPKPAVVASGNGLFTGTAGTNVALHTKLQDSQGNLYQTTAATTLIAGSTTIPVVAMTGGDFGNLPAGALLAFVTAQSGVDGTVTVDGSGFSGGVDAESAQAFGARISARIQNPPSGAGTISDYQRWAMSVAGVTRATATAGERGVGTVNVRFVMDGQANIVPTTAQIAAVQAVLNIEKPITDDAQAMAPAKLAVNYTLSNSLVATSVRPAIAQALATMHSGLAIGAGLSVQGQIIPAITSVAKLNGTFLSAPADTPANTSKVLTLGTITYS